MAIKVFGILCLIACSITPQYAYDYRPIYHQQPIAYVQQPTIYGAPVATQAAPTVYHAAPVTHQVAPTIYHAPSVTPVATLTAPAVPVLRQVAYDSVPTKYDFSYGVHDSITGDIKSQRESRDGSTVRGSYSLIDADGYKRTVTYTADDVNGFNAVVQREPLTGVVAPIAAIQYPQQQYLPVQSPIASGLPSVPVTAVEPAPVEQSVEENDSPAQQQPEEVTNSEDNNINGSQSDDDSEVIDAFGAAARSISTTESSLNQEEVTLR